MYVCRLFAFKVLNHQYMERARNLLSHDQIYGLSLLSLQLKDFITDYHAAFKSQNNMIYMMSDELLKKLNRLLKLPVNSRNKMLEVFYDTTFQLGQYYVSILSFRHPLFVERPVIPCAFLLHQRKFSFYHREFLWLVTEECTNLSKCEFAFITDREFTDFPKEIFPRARHYYCWNHLKRDVRFWAMKADHQGPDFKRKGSGTYVSDIKDLLLCESEEVGH